MSQKRNSIIPALAMMLILTGPGANAMGEQPTDSQASEQSPDADTDIAVERLQAQFSDLKFGMFIHYNMATYQNVEWVVGYPSPADFNPGVETIDTDGWADAAKAAGVKYAVLTTKHVGGFCLWDSKYTTYDVMNPDCPYKKDIVAQFVRSFTDRGIKVGLYYGWRHPGFGDPNKHKVLPPECDPATHSLEEQNAFQMKQIAELVEKYPQAFYIWNDSLDVRVMSSEDAKKFFRGLGPNIIASSNWWNWGRKGQMYLDVAVKELRAFPEGPSTQTRETCYTMAGSWFWNTKLKTAAEMKEPINPQWVQARARSWLDLMATTNARHSNFLLNISPDIHGCILPDQAAVLAEMGRLASDSGQQAK